MRDAPWHHLDRYRMAAPFGGDPGARYGAFRIPHPPTNVVLRVIADDGAETGWEHVSVSLPNRTPNWREMEFVCRLMWTDEEAVMQLHPPRSQWVNNHLHCLHLWRPTQAEIPLPPPILVGVQGAELDPKNPAHRREAAAFFLHMNRA